MKSDFYVYVDFSSSNGTVHSGQVCLSQAHSISDNRSNKINLQLAFHYYVMYWPADDKPLVKTCIHVIRIDKYQYPQIIRCFELFFYGLFITAIKLDS